mgnify:CR=1 FL=1
MSQVSYDDMLRTAQRLEKVAGPGWLSALQGIGKKVAIGAGIMGLGTAGIAAGTAGYHKIRESGRFKAMLADNPDLKKSPQGETRRLFKTLYRLSPNLAGDPTVAGTFVRRTMNLGQGVDIDTASRITKANKDMSSNHTDILGKIMSTGSAAMGIGSAMGKGD